MSEEYYLGDGLYASFDGYMLTLRAPRERGDHWVGLEPRVLLALLEYCEHIGMIKKRERRDDEARPDDY